MYVVDEVLNAGSIVVGTWLDEGSIVIGMWLDRPLESLLVVWNYPLLDSVQEIVCLGIVTDQDDQVLEARQTLVVAAAALCRCWKDDPGSSCQMRSQPLQHLQVDRESATSWQLGQPVLR